jgi:carbamoyl-phosphate synthase small subunit
VPSIHDWELVLEDGTAFPGRAFGAMRPASGEVVFATGMAGYVETLTDPSYAGQILVLTYPLQGNHGVPDGDWAEHFESPRVQVTGLVVGHATPHPSHHESRGSLGEWLGQHGVAGLEGVDTRAITQRLRERGTLRGWLIPAGLSGNALEQAKQRASAKPQEQLAWSVAPTEVKRYPPLETAAGQPNRGERNSTVLLVDSGLKEGIRRSLTKRGLGIVRVPFHEHFAERLKTEQIAGVALGNGPGDPKDLPGYIAEVRELLKADLPILGICLGHQILALAARGDTYKLPYGHRSQNQPVRDLLTGRCYVTSQNHGYAVKTESLPSGWLPWFVNLNDGTNEGLRHAERWIRSVQFHPEGSPGPEDSAWVFDEFVAQLKSAGADVREKTG